MQIPVNSMRIGHPHAQRAAHRAGRGKYCQWAESGGPLRQQKLYRNGPGSPKKFGHYVRAGWAAAQPIS